MHTKTKDGRIAKATTGQEINHPCVTIILPIEQNTSIHLKTLTDSVEKELTGQHGANAFPVIEKLHSSLAKINYDTDKKSVVIFLSPLYEKIIYLDVALVEKVVIDEPFEIRELAHCMNPVNKYILLVQSAEHFSLFLGDRSHLMKVKVRSHTDAASFKNDIPEKIEHFSDTSERKEIVLDKFIHHIDNELGDILKRYKLPVFVIGPERVNGHFKKYTHNEKAILDYIHGNYDGAKPHQLLYLIQPYLKALNEIENKELISKIEQAINTDKFCSGIPDVWKNAMRKNGATLLVEKNYTFPHHETGDDETADNISATDSIFIRDAVDIIIEKVLESGGTVKFVDGNILKNFSHIALFLYY